MRKRDLGVFYKPYRKMLSGALQIMSGFGNVFSRLEKFNQKSLKPRQSRGFFCGGICMLSWKNLTSAIRWWSIREQGFEPVALQPLSQRWPSYIAGNRKDTDN